LTHPLRYRMWDTGEGPPNLNSIRRLLNAALQSPKAFRTFFFVSSLILHPPNPFSLTPRVPSVPFLSGAEAGLICHTFASSYVPLSFRPPPNHASEPPLLSYLIFPAESWIRFLFIFQVEFSFSPWPAANSAFFPAEWKLATPYFSRHLLPAPTFSLCLPPTQHSNLRLVLHPEHRLGHWTPKIVTPSFQTVAGRFYHPA